MKIKELRELGFDELADLAVKRASECEGTRMERIEDKHLCRIFSWEGTEEGHDFWRKVDDGDLIGATMSYPELRLNARAKELEIKVDPKFDISAKYVVYREFIDEIESLIAENPNDMDLGAEIRKLFSEKDNPNDYPYVNNSVIE